MHSLSSHRENSKCRECCFAEGIKAVLPRAVRPLAASAPLLVREAWAGRAGSHLEASVSRHCFCKAVSVPVSFAGLLCRFWPAKGWRFNTHSSVQPSFSRRSARQGCSGRAATSFARGGGFGLLAGGVTQRTMHAGSVLLGALPNPSSGPAFGGPLKSNVRRRSSPPVFRSRYTGEWPKLRSVNSDI